MAVDLDDSLLERYARHILLDEIGIAGQERIAKSRILIIGLGGLGSAAAAYLAAAGIGQLDLVDHDVVDSSNLQRQILHGEADIGQPKVESARQRLLALNPHCVIQTFQCKADDALLAQWVAQQDLVLDCSDNFVTRQAVNQACVAAAKPLISASASRFDGQLALFDSASGGPCYACIFPPQYHPTEANCANMGVFAPLVGVMGSMQAVQALKWVVGLCTPQQVQTLQLYNALSVQWEQVQIACTNQCPVCSGSKTRKYQSSILNQPPPRRTLS